MTGSCARAAAAWRDGWAWSCSARLELLVRQRARVPADLRRLGVDVNECTPHPRAVVVVHARAEIALLEPDRVGRVDVADDLVRRLGEHELAEELAVALELLRLVDVERPTGQ